MNRASRDPPRPCSRSAAADGATDEPEAKPLVTRHGRQGREGRRAGERPGPGLVHPRQQASVASRITAPIRELLVGKGDRVAAGATLARLESRDLTAQREDALAAVRAGRGPAPIAAPISSRRAPSPSATSWPSRPSWPSSKARLEVIERAAHLQPSFEAPSPVGSPSSSSTPATWPSPSTPVFTVADIERRGGPRPGAARPTWRDPRRAGLRVRSRARRGDPFAGRVIGRQPAPWIPARRTVEVWCEIPNADGRLRAGTSASCAS